jgi:hypothetical protein
VTAERDALAAELTEAYPRLAGSLADLLARVRALDARLAPLGLDGVENVARDLPRHGYIAGEPVTRLVAATRLPAWDAKETVRGRDLRPVADLGPIAPAVSLDAVSYVERSKLAAWGLPA